MNTIEMNLQKMPEPLLNWYDENRRSMVWRDDPTPYHVWISEIMLQQTRIEAAKEYYIRFTSEIPDIETLATFPEERLLKLWEGLGYYNRARNLQKAARILVEKYQGCMPSDYDLLMELPGIGPYTAGAIASIAFQQKNAAVDGNVLRVVTRYLAKDDDITKISFRNRVSEELVRIMPDRSGDFNQAIMELGEVICIPNGAPLCDKCPLAKECIAFQMKKQEAFPVKPEKKERRIEKRTILVFEYHHKIAIAKRPAKGLLAGLWEFPSLEGYHTKSSMKSKYHTTNIDTLTSCKHIFSHVEWHMKGFHIQLENLSELNLPEEIVWVSIEDLETLYSLPVAFHGFKTQLS